MSGRGIVFMAIRCCASIIVSLCGKRHEVTSSISGSKNGSSNGGNVVVCDRGVFVGGAPDDSVVDVAFLTIPCPGTGFLSFRASTLCTETWPCLMGPPKPSVRRGSGAEMLLPMGRILLGVFILLLAIGGTTQSSSTSRDM